MAVDFLSASTEAYKESSAVVSAFPFTFACWFNVTSTGTSQALMALADENNNAGYARLLLSSTGPVLRADGPSITASTYDNPGANAWHHGAAVFSTSTLREVFYDGTSGGSETSGTHALTGVDNMVVAGQHANNASINATVNGKVAEAAIWTVALSDAEVASLASGISPSLIRPDSLIRYYPMITTSDAPNSIVGGTQTVNGTPTDAADHPAVFRSHKGSF